MIVTRILEGLERMDAEGPDADAAARAGFLEWAFAQPGAATPEAARAALMTARHAAPDGGQSAAAEAFVAYLNDATMGMAPSGRRGRGDRRKRLH